MLGVVTTIVTSFSIHGMPSLIQSFGAILWDPVKKSSALQYCHAVVRCAHLPAPQTCTMIVMYMIVLRTRYIGTVPVAGCCFIVMMMGLSPI